MKTEKELRKHLADMKARLNEPCNCAARGHSFECEMGGRMVLASIDLLRWVLNENGDYDRVVEVFAMRK